MVPAVRVSILRRSLSPPIAAGFPVVEANSHAATTFGRIEPYGKSRCISSSESG